MFKMPPGLQLMKLASLSIILAFALAWNMDALGNELFKYGTPYIRHFTKKEYKAGNQNWSITQDEDGFIYVGNSNGLQQFDGNRWSKYNLPSGTIVRSIYAYDNRIYCGSLGELGYWEKDENFEMHYTSLTSYLADYDFGDEEIWWITEFKGNIVFQSFSTTFMFDGESIDIILKDQGVIFPPFVINNRLFIQVLDRGIFEIVDRLPVFVQGSEIFISKRVNTMLPFSEPSKILIGTEDDGFYIYQNNTFTPWTIPDKSEIFRDQINRGIKITDGLFAIGTLLGGIYIINEEGQILNQIDKSNGLNNNTVLSFFLDKKSNLWVGLDNGIDLIKVNSPIYYNTDVSGNIGSVYTSAIYKGDLYLGTNRGVFYTNFNQPSVGSNKFHFIPGSQGQIWSLAVIDNQLFCGHNTSTFVINDYQLEKISNVAGGYEIKQYPYDNNFILQGSYNGLSVYRKVGGNWEYAHLLPGFSKLSKKVEFERENVLWVSHTHRGLYRLEISNDFTEITEIREFSTDSKAYVNKLNKKLVISSDSGFLYYDDIQNTFYFLDEINRALGKFSINAHIISAGGDNYWIFKDGDCARAIMDENSVAEIDDNVLNDLNEYLIPGYEDIYVVDSSFTIIYLDNGYAVFHNQWMDRKPEYTAPILVRKLSFENVRGELYMPEKRNNDIPFKYNNVNLQISYPEFSREIGLMYKLEGYDERWNMASAGDKVTFQNLPYGEYVVRLRPENGFQEEEVLLNFTINPPWFKSITAQFLYAFISILTVILFVFLNSRKIIKIHEKHELERKRILHRESVENEKKVIEIRNENLRNELKLRNSRLAKSTFSLIHKNNTLISVKEELIRIKEELGARFPSKYFNQLTRKIDHDLTSEKDWKLFEHSFSEVHEHFLHKLKDQYPDLTPADIQLCAYLKMNLSSKEIASLLNITIRGVEVRRYRLRKKLHLDHETNLTEYIMGY